MSAQGIIAFVAASVVLVSFAVIAVMLIRGKWLCLLTGHPKSRRATQDVMQYADNKQPFTAVRRNMIILLIVGCLLVATLIIFGVARTLGNSMLESLATPANNLCFLALIISLSWFFVSLGPTPKKHAELGNIDYHTLSKRRTRLDHLSLATMVFIVVFLALIVFVGLLF